jgi:hypothetical protein
VIVERFVEEYFGGAYTKNNAYDCVQSRADQENGSGSGDEMLKDAVVHSVQHW